MKKLLPLIFSLLFAALPSFAQQDSISRDVDLGNITVEGSRPLVKTEGSKQTITVKGSFLGKMGTLGNMLTATPGIVSKGRNSFEVIGKGTPKYYVDGKEVTQQDIFTTLKSAEIEKIEIDREPSARYPSGTNAVVNIYTIRPLTDYISLDLNNWMSIQRKFSENPSFTFKMKSGIWSWKLGYDYDVWNNLNKETYYTQIYHPDRTFRSDEANHNFMGSFSHDVVWANDFMLGKDHRISLAYYFQHMNDKDINDETMTYSEPDIYQDKEMQKRNITRRNTHNITLSYTGKISKSSNLYIGGDYSIINENSQTRNSETNLGTLAETNIFTNYKNKYNILTANAVYSFKLPYEISAEAGGRYYNVSNKYNYLTDNPNLAAGSALNRQETDDNVSAGYVSLSRKWKKASIKLGGRYEYSDTRVKVKNTDGVGEDSYHTSFFLPSAALAVYPWKDWYFELNYSRSVERQGYMGLNPYPVYQDSLAYSMGNRDLLPSTRDRYALYAGWKNLTLSVGYSHTKDMINTVVYCPDQTTDIVCEVPVNLDRYESFFASLGYSSMIGKKLYFSGSVYLNFPKNRYEFLGETVHAEKASCSGNFNLSYRINELFSAYTTYSFQSRSEWLNVYQRPASNWSVGVESNLLKDRLSMTLSFTDILHDANYNNMDIRYLNTMHGTYGTNDMRGVSLSLSLNLFNQDINVRASKNNSEVIERTK